MFSQSNDEKDIPDEDEEEAEDQINCENKGQFVPEMAEYYFVGNKCFYVADDLWFTDKQVTSYRRIAEMKLNTCFTQYLQIQKDSQC